MSKDIIELVAGSVHPEHFDLLVDITMIRSEAVINALRYHLVEGKEKAESVRLSGTSFAQFSSRLQIIFEANQKGLKLSRFYLEGVYRDLDGEVRPISEWLCYRNSRLKHPDDV